ncbi:MAG TPA: MarR family transcriptional regulator [Planctomycetota bacterium]|nr:MarR family transcriptional regulator [Planctomycetota bacterium]
MSEELVHDGRRCATLMCRSCSRLCRVMNGILAKTGVNMAQCHAMSVLAEKGEMTMGVLARALGVTMGATTNLMDKLVEAELVSRERDESDRRVVKVKLTPAGVDTLEGDMVSLSEFWAMVFEQIDGRDRTGFFEIYEQILRLAESAGRKK